MAEAIARKPLEPAPKGSAESKEVVAEHVSNEIVFAIVGHVGSGNTQIADTLKSVIERHKIDNQLFAARIIKARTVIAEWMRQNGLPLQAAITRLSDVEKYQDAGDRMRLSDHAAVARGAVEHIRRERASMQSSTVEREKPVIPDGKPRAFIIDSIRHPAEAGLLRRIYGDAFVLIGVVCEQNERRRRISKKYEDAGDAAAERFMRRDAKASEKHGQRVSDAFHLSDFFVDNTPQRLSPDGRTGNPDWDVVQNLERLIMLVTHTAVVRPTTAETAMHAAAGAAMRSACLSRQVGAALTDSEGNVIGTGTNEVPKAGGGVYGQGFDDAVLDDRCAFGNRYCSNTREQKRIAEEILADLFSEEDAKRADATLREALIAKNSRRSYR
jgi:deoxycytidylate deaminase